MTHPKSFLESLQVLRGVAALMVVVYHVTMALYLGDFITRGEVWDLGSRGVDLFFVLSGFIIFHVHRVDLGHPSALPRYCIRRVFRIYPPYWAVLVPLLGFSLLWPQIAGAQALGLQRILSSFFLLPEFAGWPVLNVAWSLSYELFFYAVFGLAIFSRLLGAVVAGSVLLGSILAGFGCWDSPLLLFVFSGYNLQFFFGAVTAYLYADRTISLPRKLGLLVLISLVVVGLGIMGSESFFGILLAGAIAAMLILWSLEGARTNVPLSGALFSLGAFLGNASYSIYLVHNPVVGLVTRLSRGWGFESSLLVGAMSLILSVAASVVFYLLVEKPLLKRVRGFKRKTIGENALEAR